MYSLVRRGSQSNIVTGERSTLCRTMVEPGPAGLAPSYLLYCRVSQSVQLIAILSSMALESKPCCVVCVTHRGCRQYCLIPVGRSHCTRNVPLQWRSQCEVPNVTPPWLARATYSDHIATHHGLKRYVCVLCQRQFTFKHSWKSNILHCHRHESMPCKNIFVMDKLFYVVKHRFCGMLHHPKVFISVK